MLEPMGETIDKMITYLEKKVEKEEGGALVDMKPVFQVSFIATLTNGSVLAEAVLYREDCQHLVALVTLCATSLPHSAASLVYSHLEDFFQWIKNKLDNFMPNLFMHSVLSLMSHCASPVRQNVDSPFYRGHLQSKTQGKGDD